MGKRAERFEGTLALGLQTKAVAEEIGAYVSVQSGAVVEWQVAGGRSAAVAESQCDALNTRRTHNADVFEKKTFTHATAWPACGGASSPCSAARLVATAHMRVLMWNIEVSRFDTIYAASGSFEA